tara:strand:- start:1743 stop:2213 length:471 start_codon:yes stop_codon:yes gene_type:complete
MRWIFLLLLLPFVYAESGYEDFGCFRENSKLYCETVKVFSLKGEVEVESKYRGLFYAKQYDMLMPGDIIYTKNSSIALEFRYDWYEEFLGNKSIIHVDKYSNFIIPEPKKGWMVKTSDFFGSVFSFVTNLPSLIKNSFIEKKTDNSNLNRVAGSLG